MSSLDEKIRAQYGSRPDVTGLYDSLYSRLADIEKRKAAFSLLGDFARGRTVLEVGAGQGGNVPMLQELGFRTENIFLNELLPDRVAMARDRFPDIKMYPGNLLDVYFDRQFDCVFQSTVFTSLLDDGHRRSVAAKMWQLLKPGGIILWYDFIYNNPRNPGVRKVELSEVRSLFPEALATEFRKITLAPPIGRRVGKLYKLFNFPFLRTHILAVIHKS